MSDTKIGDDLIRGAGRIADELKWTKQQVFRAHAAHLLPTFKIGKAVCARRSSLREHFELLERQQAGA